MKRGAVVSSVWLVLLGCLSSCDPGRGVDLDSFEIVDLSHTFDESTLYWPTSPSTFKLEPLAFGETDGGWFYSANSFCAPEHGGTHLDAPIHFARDRWTTEQIPLERLIGPAVVIDVSIEAADDPDYRLTRQAVLDWESRQGKVEPGSIVLLHTGWSRYWPNRKPYLGDDVPGEVANLHFPSYGEDAAHLLVNERQVAALGVDTASIDYGQSDDFIVHRVAATKNVVGLENLTRLDHLPAKGAWVLALPIKIKGGSGGPARVVALVPPE